MNHEPAITRERMKTPRAASIAGILFSVLLIISLVLIRISVPGNPQDAGEWLSGSLRSCWSCTKSCSICGNCFFMVHWRGARPSWNP